MVPAATVPRKSMEEVSPDESARDKAGEALSLSPKRIEDGASTNTELLKKILAQTSTVTHCRHSGINE
jgi:hypothetical protein